jgi:hypothetical protein
MKKKILVLVVAFLILHFTFILLFNLLNNSRNELVLRFNDILNDTLPYKTVLAGDSHIERSIEYDSIDDCFSIAYFGENNVMTYYKLKYLFEHNNLIEPKYVVFPCDIVTFAKGFNLYRSQIGFYDKFIPWGELKNFEPNLYSSYYNYMKLYLFPYIEWQYAMNTAHQNREKKNSLKLTSKSKRQRKKMVKTFVQQELMCAENKNNLFDEKALEYLVKTIELCKQYNVKPIFIKLPHTKEVFTEIENNVNPKFITERPSEKIITNYNIPILDFERIFENNPELFFDVHHLNNDGKKLFTPIFEHALDSLYRIY